MDEIALLVKRTVSEIEGGKRGRESRTRGMYVICGLVGG